MKKKLFVIVVLTILVMIFIIPKGKEESVKVKKENYNTFNLKTGVEYLIEKANSSSITNYNDGNKGEMYTFSHGATEQTPEQTDYRYIGNNPNNYLFFNCEDENDISTCEVWRIIGVFSVEDENGKFSEKIKIVRGEPLETTMSYKEADDDNYWRYSTVSSFLNNKYYNRVDSASSYGLFESARLLASNTRYYLGGLRMNSSSPLFGNADTLYSQERSNDLYDKNNESRETHTDDNYIGLMYPSDNYYIYGKGVDDGCYESPYECSDEHPERGWFYNIIKNFGSTWSITPNAIYEHESYYDAFFHSGGSLIFSNPSTLKYIEPTIYLNSDVIIVGGDGSEDSPYLLAAKDDYLYNLDYAVGDNIEYNGELYTVVENSSKDMDYVTIMKNELLTNKYTDYFIDNKAGLVPYYESENCNSENSSNNYISNCNSNYDVSTVKKVIEEWASNELDLNDLISVDDYKVRLISLDELIYNLGFESTLDVSNNSIYAPSESSPDFIKNNNVSTWTMSLNSDNNKIIVISNNNYYESLVYDYVSVKPVINFKKKSLGNKSEYNIGEKVVYKGSDYYVISNSDSNIDYVTVLKDKALSRKQILSYGNFKEKAGRINYIDCNSDECIVNFDNSNIKKVIDYWMSNNFDEDDLVSVDGYKGRVLSLNELIENWNFKKRDNGLYYFGYKEPDWLYRTNNLILMDTKDNNIGYLLNSYGRYIEEISLINMSNEFVVRPVINLKKSSINKNRTDNSDNSNCKMGYKKINHYIYSRYFLGQRVNYNGVNYYVINDSLSDDDYVTLLKAKPLSYNEILKYSANLNIDVRQKYNYGLVQYYYAEDCYYNNNQDNNLTGCTTDYKKSFVKKIVDSWVSDNVSTDSLVQVDDYMSRIISIDDLVNNLGYRPHEAITNILYKLTDDVPDWVYNEKYAQWTMSQALDDEFLYVMQENGDIIDGHNEHYLESNLYMYNVVRPVINLNKCALEGGCLYDEEYVCIDDIDNSDDSMIGKVIVTVANTLKYLPQIILFISIILIIIGLSIFGYNYYKSRKERR